MLKKHPCPDCQKCQWCSDSRCSLCRRPSKPCARKLSQAEQIALYESINRPRPQEKGSLPIPLRVLFICSDGSCLGPMAARLMNHDFADRLQAWHACLTPKNIHPQTSAVLAEIGIEPNGSTPVPLSRYERESFDVVIALDETAIEKSPAYFGGVKKQTLEFADPNRTLASEEKSIEVFRATRDALRQQLGNLLRQRFAPS